MWIFRLPPLVHILLGLAGVALAVFLFVDDQQKEAAKTVARSAKAPDPVAIEKFDPAKNEGAAHEAVILGQVDLNQSYELTKTRKGRETGHFVFAPIYAVDAKDTSAPAIGVLMQEGKLNDTQIEHLVVSMGPVGPVMKLDGTVLSASDVSEASQFREHVQVAPNAIYIDPFEEGRGEGLRASTTGRDVSIGVLVASLALGAFGLFRFLRARKAQEMEAEGTI